MSLTMNNKHDPFADSRWYTVAGNAQVGTHV